MFESLSCWKDDNGTLHLTCERCGFEDEVLVDAPPDPWGVHDHDPFWRYHTDWFYKERTTVWPDEVRLFVICPGCMTDEDRRELAELCPNCGADEDTSWFVKSWRGTIAVCGNCAPGFEQSIHSVDVFEAQVAGEPLPSWLSRRSGHPPRPFGE